MKHVSKQRCSKTYFLSVILKYQINTQNKLDFKINVIYEFTKKLNILVFSRNFSKKINKNQFLQQTRSQCILSSRCRKFSSCVLVISFTLKVFVISCYAETRLVTIFMFHINDVQFGWKNHRKDIASWKEGFHLQNFFQNFDHLFIVSRFS